MLRCFALTAFLAVASPAAQAHMSGHGTLDEDQILVVASNAAAWLSKNEVEKDWSPLPASWAEIPTSQVKIIARVDGDFVVSLRNDAERTVLYLLIAGDGGVMDANFTGAFPYIYEPGRATDTPASE